MPHYFPLFGALDIEKAFLIANGHLVNGIGLNKILGDRTIDTTVSDTTIGLETAFVDVNHFHKARYSVQLSVVSIYACLKEAHTHATVVQNHHYSLGLTEFLIGIRCLSTG